MVRACPRLGGSQKSPGSKVRAYWWLKAAVVVPFRRDGAWAYLHMSRNLERSLRGYEAEESRAR